MYKITDTHFKKMHLKCKKHVVTSMDICLIPPKTKKLLIKIIKIFQNIFLSMKGCTDIYSDVVKEPCISAGA